MVTVMERTDIVVNFEMFFDAIEKYPDLRAYMYTLWKDKKSDSWYRFIRGNIVPEGEYVTFDVIVKYIKDNEHLHAIWML